MDKTVGFYWEAKRASTQHELVLLKQVGTRVVVVPHQAVTLSLLQSVRTFNMQVYVDFSLFVGEQWRHTFPDSIPVESDGKLFQPDGWYAPVCPNHATIRRRHLENISMLMEQFGGLTDGVWLDFIRYPVRWEVEHPKLRQTCFAIIASDYFGSVSFGSCWRSSPYIVSSIVAERCQYHTCGRQQRR